MEGDEVKKRIFLEDTTAMCWAAKMGNIDLLKELLSQGADVNGADYDDR